MQDMRHTSPMTTPLTDGGMNTTTPMGGGMAPESHRKSSSVLVSIIVIILLIVGALWFLGKGKDDGVTYDEEGNAITHAPAGSLVAGFPQELLLEPSAAIETGYSIAYTGRGEQMPVARYMSTLEFHEVVDGYRRLLVDGGWVVLKDGSIDELPVTNFSAQRNGETVNITLTLQQSGKAVVEVAYTMPVTQ